MVFSVAGAPSMLSIAWRTVTGIATWAAVYATTDAIAPHSTVR